MNGKHVSDSLIKIIAKFSAAGAFRGVGGEMMRMGGQITISGLLFYLDSAPNAFECVTVRCYHSRRSCSANPAGH